MLFVIDILKNEDPVIQDPQGHLDLPSRLEMDPQKEELRYPVGGEMLPAGHGLSTRPQDRSGISLFSYLT